jgi:hypothetical protein
MAQSPYADFTSFLSRHEETDFQKCSIVSFNGLPKPGKWNIPEANMPTFFKIFSRLQPQRRDYHFVEQWPKNSEFCSLVFDFDLKPEHISNVDFSAEGLRKLLAFFKTLIKLDIPADALLVKKIADDSYHIVLPSIGTTFGNMKLWAADLSTYYNLDEGEVDDAIYTTKRGLRMIYCTKPDQPGRMAKLLDPNRNSRDLRPLEIENDLARCSIFRTKFQFTVPDIVRGEPSTFKEEEEKEEVSRDGGHSKHRLQRRTKRQASIF